MTFAPKPYLGPLPEDIWEVLTVAGETKGLSLQGDFTRLHASTVALCASGGWLTTISPDGHTYSTNWRLTASGQALLENSELFTQ